jgi:hypothetical protein
VFGGFADARRAGEEQHAPVTSTYAVLWRTDRGPIYAGQLELRRQGFQLDGADWFGDDSVEVVDAGDIASLRIGRAGDERVEGRSTLIVERSSGNCLHIASAIGVGMLHELADAVGRLTGGSTGN